MNSITRTQKTSGLFVAAMTTAFAVILTMGFGLAAQNAQADHVTSSSTTTVFVDMNSGTTTEDGTSDAPYHEIQDGIDHANSGDTIEVADGTYDGGVISKALTINGPNAGIAGDDSRNAEAVLSDGFTFSTNSFLDDVTINGFQFDGSDPSGINANNAGDNLTISNNYFNGTTNGIIHGGQTGGQDHVKDGWVVSNNFVDGVELGARLWNLSNLEVTDNNFTNLSDSGVSLVAVDGAEVSGNSFSSITKSGVYVDSGWDGSNLDADTQGIKVHENNFENVGSLDTYQHASVKIGAGLDGLGEVSVQDNNFLSAPSDSYGIFVDDGNSSTDMLDGIHNFWGNEDGPGNGVNATSSDGADVSTSSVTYEPWLCDEFDGERGSTSADGCDDDSTLPQCEAEFTINLESDDSATTTDVTSIAVDNETGVNGDEFSLFASGDVDATTATSGTARIERTQDGVKLFFGADNSDDTLYRLNGTLQLDDVDMSNVSTSTLSGADLEDSGNYPDTFEINGNEVTFNFYVRGGNDSFVISGLDTECDGTNDDGNDAGDDNGEADEPSSGGGGGGDSLSPRNGNGDVAGDRDDASDDDDDDDSDGQVLGDHDENDDVMTDDEISAALSQMATQLRNLLAILQDRMVGFPNTGDGSISNSIFAR